MNEGIKIILWVILGLAVLTGISWGLAGADLAFQKFWKPKYEDMKRDVWEQTSSRINGATQQIAKSQLEYSRSNSDVEKKAICAYLRNSYPDITPEEIDDNTLRHFFSSCKYGGN